MRPSENASASLLHQTHAPAPTPPAPALRTSPPSARSPHGESPAFPKPPQIHESRGSGLPPREAGRSRGCPSTEAQAPFRRTDNPNSGPRGPPRRTFWSRHWGAVAGAAAGPLAGVGFTQQALATARGSLGRGRSLEGHTVGVGAGRCALPKLRYRPLLQDGHASAG